MEEEKIIQEINTLRDKYETLSKKVDRIEKESKNTENSIKRIENSMGMMNNHFEELMKKLDNIVEDKESNKMFNEERKSNFSLKGMLTRPIRKLVVGTMSSVFSLADYASEKAAYAREGMEDIIAEAQYKSKLRKADMMQDMVPNE